MQHDKPNFMGARIMLPSNLNFHEWHAIAQSPYDKETVEFLQYDFAVGFVGPTPTPSTSNHLSANCHPLYVAIYIAKEVGEGPCWDLSFLPRSLPGARIIPS